MKYTEPMFYGTMRGYPPALNSPSPHFFPQMREVAVVLCSCLEYLNGTKKESKKATICKKCRGTRLPLTPIGGTVRIHSSTPMIQAARGSAGTVRLPSAFQMKQQRPSILSAESDPYDMMRRSRLVSPELQPVNNVLKTTSFSSKNRAKSSSPSRGRRGRSRRRSPSPSKMYGIPNASIDENRSRSTNRQGNGYTIEPEVESSPMSSSASGANRRSILHCDLSAYELISTISHNNEFSPMVDDDVYSMHSPSFDRVSNKGKDFGLDLTPLSGQRINFSALKSPIVNDKIDACVYDKVDFAGSDLSTGSKGSSNRIRVSQIEDKSPIRPPRTQRKSESMQPTALDTETHSTFTSPSKKEFVLTSTVLSNISNDIVPPQLPPPIKSILKRPSSVSSDSQPSSLTGSDLDGRTTRNSNGSESTIKIAKGKVSISLTKANNIEHRDAPNKDKRNSGSQFYLPMPQRKKVQFLVDNDIIYDHETHPNSTTSTESYFGENDQRHNEISVYTDPNCSTNPNTAFDINTDAQQSTHSAPESFVNFSREFCNYSLVATVTPTPPPPTPAAVAINGSDINATEQRGLLAPTANDSGLDNSNSTLSTTIIVQTAAVNRNSVTGATNEGGSPLSAKLRSGPDGTKTIIERRMADGMF